MRQRGFTLVELIVSIAVLGFLLMAALPSIGTWLDNTRIRNTAEALQQGLQTARNEAIKGNREVSFFLVSLTSPHTMDDSCALSSASGSWVVSTSSPASECGGNEQSSPPILASRTAGDAGGRVNVTAVSGDDSAATTVTFNGFGRAIDVGSGSGIARIDVTGPNDDTTYRPLRLLVTPAGSVRMCDPSESITDGDPRKC